MSQGLSSVSSKGIQQTTRQRPALFWLQNLYKCWSKLLYFLTGFPVSAGDVAHQHSGSEPQGHVKRCNVNFPSYGSYGSYGQAVRRGTAVTTQVVQECNPSGRATQAKNCGSPLGNNWKFGSHCFTYPGTFRAMCVMMAQKKKRLQGSSKDLLSTLFLHLKIPKVGC